MYKVFIDNAAILFRKSFFYQSAIPKKFLPTLPPILFSQFKEELTQISKEKEFVVLTPNPKHALQSFFKDFRWIEAAGGIVVHKENKKSLFIFRNDKWDIPKGKIENGETPTLGAIREIQEECGIKSLKIIHELTPTYHVYHAYNEYWIKKTYWYILETEEEKVTPQLEEGISKVEWLTQEEIQDKVEKNTYSSIKDVLQEFSAFKLP